MLDFSGFKVLINNVELVNNVNIIIPAIDGAYGTSFNLNIEFKNISSAPISMHSSILRLIFPKSLSFEGINDEYTSDASLKERHLIQLNINDTILPNSKILWNRVFTNYVPTNYTVDIQPPIEMLLRFFSYTETKDYVFTVQPKILENCGGV
jgi:hypothetical protein